MITVAHIGSPSKSEIEAYKEYKNKLKEEAMLDEEKQSIKKVKHITVLNGIRAGICPTCGHCLIFCDTECDECFQKVRWFGKDNYNGE